MSFTKSNVFTPNNPIPVAIYFHGQGDDVMGRIDDPTLAALRAGGWSVVTADFHGSNWGNQDALNDLRDALDWMEARFTIGPVLLFGGSMGGLASLNALHGGMLDTYDVRGWYGTMPACSLANAYASGGSFTTQIESVYGFTGAGGFDAATAGYDPCDTAAAAWPDVRYRFLASTADTLVPQADHTDVLRAILPATAIENSLLATTGAHGDSSHFNATDIAEFAARCLADS